MDTAAGVASWCRGRGTGISCCWTSCVGPPPGSPTRPINSSSRSAYWRSRKTRSSRPGSVKGRPVAGSKPCSSKSANSPASWASRPSIRWPVSRSRIERVVAATEARATAITRSSHSRMRTRAETRRRSLVVAGSVVGTGLVVIVVVPLEAVGHRWPGHHLVAGRGRGGWGWGWTWTWARAWGSRSPAPPSPGPGFLRGVGEGEAGGGDAEGNQDDGCQGRQAAGEDHAVIVRAERGSSDECRMKKPSSGGVIGHRSTAGPRRPVAPTRWSRRFSTAPRPLGALMHPASSCPGRSRTPPPGRAGSTCGTRRACPCPPRPGSC